MVFTLTNFVFRVIIELFYYNDERLYGDIRYYHANGKAVPDSLSRLCTCKVRITRSAYKAKADKDFASCHNSADDD